MRILILGGTAQARELAAELCARDEHRIILSLAGRTGETALPVPSGSRLRVGGFGGADGLAAYLRCESIDVLIDATHPFAGAISENAAAASTESGIRLLAIRRPRWQARPGDRWTHVPDVASAAAHAAESADGLCVFVTTGRLEARAYASDQQHTYLIRTVTAPDGPLPPHHTLVLDRGPYTVAGETELMARHDVAVLVTKNSGGTSTSAKLTAARQRGIPVIMVDPPALPAVDEVYFEVAEVVRRVNRDHLTERHSPHRPDALPITNG